MRRWKIKLEFANGSEHLGSFTLKDIAAFVKHERIRNKEAKIHKVIPLDKWLIVMLFDLAARVCPIAELTNATMFKEDKNG